MAITEVGAGSQRAEVTASNVASGAVAFPANVGSGNLLIVAGVNWAAAVRTLSITDTLTTSYTQLTVDFGSVFKAFIAYGVSSSAGANTVTVEPNLGANYMSFAIDEFSGQHATPLDVDGGSSTGTDTAPQDALTTIAADDLLIGVMGFTDSASATTITPGGSYTQFGEEENNSANTASNEVLRIVTTAQSYTVDWTVNATRTWTAYTAAFKPAAGGVTTEYVGPISEMRFSNVMIGRRYI